MTVLVTDELTWIVGLNHLRNRYEDGDTREIQDKPKCQLCVFFFLWNEQRKWEEITSFVTEKCHVNGLLLLFLWTVTHLMKSKVIDQVEQVGADQQQRQP